MIETDLQLGGGYIYQWRCAILLALNYFFAPVCVSHQSPFQPRPTLQINSSQSRCSATRY